MKRHILAVAALVVLGSMIGFRLAQKRAEADSAAREREARMKRPPAVSVAAVRVQDVVRAFEGVGTVEAPLSVQIAAKVTGRILFLQAREGDRVRKGQVLVRMDPTEVEANLMQQQAALAEARYRLAQARITQTPTDVSVATQLRQQQAALTSAQADFDQARETCKAQVASADAQSDNAKAEVASAQASLANAQARYERVQALYKQGFIAAQDVDDARTGVGVRQAGLDAAKARLKSAQEQAGIARSKGTADVEAARARLAQARAAVDYAQANTAQKPAYQESLAALQAMVSSAQGALKAAASRRADTVLAAPLDGFVTGRFLDPGAVATIGQPILAVQFMRQLWVKVPVPEESSRWIFVGMPARVTLDAVPAHRFSGRVTQVNPSADPQSRRFSVTITLDSPGSVIRPGMFAHVSIETQRVRGALVVPLEAVQRDKAGSFVIVVDKSGIARRTAITPGGSGTDVVIVSKGLRPGERVVTLSAYPLKDGQAVVPRRGR